MINCFPPFSFVSNVGYKQAREKTQRRITEKGSVLPPPGYYLEIEEEEESWLHPQTAVVTPRAGAHWDEASTDGEESEEELEMSEGEHNVESGGNSDL